MEFPEDLYYTEEHEYIRIDGNVAIIGITDYAQDQLGDIVFVDVDTVGDTLTKGEVFGTIEAVKTVSDLYMPLSGEIIELNEALSDSPESVNASPYEEGWIIKVKLTDKSELDDLLTQEAYKEVIGATD